jgi:hypothetical protein
MKYENLVIHVLLSGTSVPHGEEHDTRYQPCCCGQVVYNTKWYKLKVFHMWTIGFIRQSHDLRADVTQAAGEGVRDPKWRD